MPTTQLATGTVFTKYAEFYGNSCRSLYGRIFRGAMRAYLAGATQQTPDCIYFTAETNRRSRMKRSARLTRRGAKKNLELDLPAQLPAGYRHSISTRSPHEQITKRRTTLSPSLITSTVGCEPAQRVGDAARGAPPAAGATEIAGAAIGRSGATESIFFPWRNEFMKWG